MVWDIEKFSQDNTDAGRPPKQLRTSEIKYEPFSRKYLKKVLTDVGEKVYRDGNQVIIAQGGLLLWQTHGADRHARAKRRTDLFHRWEEHPGQDRLVIHLTAPTIHSSWTGNVTMEIANFGPFDLVLQEYDVVAQLTVSTITFGQSGVGASKGH